MTWTIIEKEIRIVLTSPKFVTTFTVFSILVLLSITLGVREYRSFEAQQNAARGLVQQEMNEAKSWSEVRPRAFRPVDPLQIFVSGVHNDVGRFSLISSAQDIKLRRGIYEDNPALAVFRALDLVFIVTVVLSLLAILFTYDAVSGERENGTLCLTLSNPVPRSKLILGKFIGTWLGLAAPLVLPILIGILGVVLSGVGLSGSDWSRLALLFGAATFYFTFFVALGLAVSALSRRSSTSFLALLAVWVIVVLIVPRAGLTAAANLRPVPTVAEIESAKAAFENAKWNNHRTQLGEAWRERSAQMEGLSESEREKFEDENLWSWMEKDDEIRKETEQQITANALRLDEQLRNKKAEQARLALSLGRPSPATSFQLVAMKLGETDHNLKDRAEEAMHRYLGEYERFVEEQTGSAGGQRRVTVRRGGGAHFSFSSDDGVPVDLSQMPLFEMERPRFAQLAGSVVGDLGLLAALCLLCFTIAFVGFLRQDVIG
jgi:ABC-type transport system involved in multi-copper enzyme maturation permease subunit